MNSPPQLRLPLQVGIQRRDLPAPVAQDVVAGKPVREPVRTIDLVLVVEIGEPPGELVALAWVGVIAQIVVQRGECLRVGLQLIGDESIDPPLQTSLFKRRCLGDSTGAEHGATGLPEE